MTKLTPHFTTEEFCASQTASRLGIDNSLPIDLVENAKRTCEGLESVRIILNANVIHVSSGYRCKKLNDAVGSKDTSQHLKAQAADILCPAFGSPAHVMHAIVNSALNYDQCLLEFADKGGGWVHISFSDNPRKQALIVGSHGTRDYV